MGSTSLKPVRLTIGDVDGDDNRELLHDDGRVAVVVHPNRLTNWQSAQEWRDDLARLIAAAPEMAEALRECHKMLIDMDDRDELTEDDATLERQIRALLARIDGTTEGGAK